MALTKDTPRAFELGSINSLAVKAASKIYEGAFVGIEVATGYARPLVAGDVFAGIAETQADNSGGSNGDIRVRVRTEGAVEMPVTGAVVTSAGVAVYASADDTLTMTVGSNTKIGKVARFISGTTCLVQFNANLF